MFAEEAVSRVHGVAAVGARRRDYGGDVEIGAHAMARDQPRMVGLADMQRARVILGKDRHRRDAEFGGGTGDADGNLAAIGDQQLLDGHSPDPLSRHCGGGGIFAVR